MKPIDPRHIVTTVPFSNWFDDPIDDDKGTDIDIEVSVTYLPRPGSPDYFSKKHGCWFPGEPFEIEVISVDYIPGSKLEDMSLWSAIEARVRKDLMQDDLELREHFQEHTENNADSRDDSHAMRDALNELLHNRSNDYLCIDDQLMIQTALGEG